MSEWLARNVTPPKNRLIIAYCPMWCDSGYQICEYSNGKFSYADQPNDSFNECVVKWSLFMEAE